MSAWTEYFKKKDSQVVKVNSRKGGGIKSIQRSDTGGLCRRRLKETESGILNRPVRAMVVGIRM